MAVFAMLAIAGCAQDKAAETAQQVEIKDYEGEKLGSVRDFRENSIAGVQKIDPKKYHLDITGLVDKPTSFTLPELAEFKRVKKLIQLDCVEGWSVKALWEGIPLSEIFSRVKPRPQANTVIFYSEDGYSTSHPLDYIKKRNIIIADKINGITLPPAQGFPFILVAESKWGYKWARWITRIEISDNPDFRGYWEKRGYSNKGDLSGSMFEKRERF